MILNASFLGAFAGNDVRFLRHKSPTRTFADWFVGDLLSCRRTKAATSFASVDAPIFRAASTASFMDFGVFLSTSGAAWRNVDGALTKWASRGETLFGNP